MNSLSSSQQQFVTYKSKFIKFSAERVTIGNTDSPLPVNRPNKQLKTTTTASSTTPATNVSENEINISILFMIIIKKDKPQLRQQSTSIQDEAYEYKKSLNKKGHSEDVRFDRAPFTIPSNTITYNGQRIKFQSIVSSQLVLDTHLNQYCIYLLVQIISDHYQKENNEYVLGYLNYEDIVRSLSFVSTATTTTSTNSTATTTKNQENNLEIESLKIIHRFTLPKSATNHYLLDGPCVVSLMVQSKGSMYIIQRRDRDGDVGSSSPFIWRSIELKDLPNSKFLSCFVNISNSDTVDVNPVIISYLSAPYILYSQISSLKNKSEPAKGLQKIESKLIHFAMYQSFGDDNSGYFSAVLDQSNNDQQQQQQQQWEVGIYSIDSGDKVWSLKLLKKPTNIYWVNIPLEFDYTGISDQAPEMEKWSQGALVVHFTDNDNRVEIYCVATKTLMNELLGVHELWINDFMSTGLDQLLVRHVGNKKFGKSVFLSLVHLYSHPSNNIVESIGGANSNHIIGDDENVEPVNVETIIDSLESRCLEANKEIGQQKKLLKVKQNLLNHSIKILESLGTSHTDILATAPTPDQWGYQLKPIFNRNGTATDQQQNFIPKVIPATMKEGPILNSKRQWVNNSVLYSILNIKSQGIKELIVLSVFICTESSQLKSKSIFTQSNENSIGWSIGGGGDESIPIYVETTLPELDTIDTIDSKFSILLEWGYKDDLTTTNSLMTGTGNFSYNNNNLYSTFLDKFSIKDLLLNQFTTLTMIPNQMLYCK
eukprot:gene11380-13936_t